MPDAPSTLCEGTVPQSFEGLTGDPAQVTSTVTTPSPWVRDPAVTASAAVIAKSVVAVSSYTPATSSRAVPAMAKTSAGTRTFISVNVEEMMSAGQELQGRKPSPSGMPKEMTTPSGSVCPHSPVRVTGPEPAWTETGLTEVRIGRR